MTQNKPATKHYKRNRYLIFRVTQGERAAVVARARKSRQTVSEYVRERVFGGKVA